MIRGTIEQTGVKIDVEDDGTIHVASAEVGKTYLGKMVRLVDFGAFVEIFPGTDGLLHISEIAENHNPRRPRRAEGERSVSGQGPGARKQQHQAEPL